MKRYRVSGRRVSEVRGSALVLHFHHLCFGVAAKKLLTTIALSCFSVVAYADIWFCQTSHWAILDKNAKFAAEHKSDFVVDTEKGFRTAESLTGFYRGSCSEAPDGYGQSKIFCGSEDLTGSVNEEQLFIDLEQQTFTYVRTGVWGGFGVGIQTNIGTCTKA